MKIGRTLSMIDQYTVQFNMEGCKSCGPDLGHNTILKIIKRRLES